MNFNKRIFAIVILLLVMVSHALGHVTGRNLQNFQYNAELAPVAPIVDGYLDDPVWKRASPGKLEQDLMSGNRWRESPDFTGAFGAVWRNGFLYVAIELVDDQLENRQKKVLREDHLIVYVDPHHSGRMEDLYRFQIPIEKEMGTLKSPLTRVAWGNDGRTCELSFRLDNLARKGNSIGFFIAYNDVDSGHLQHKIAWAPEGYTEENDHLPDLVFTARIEPTRQQKLILWGHIKSLY
ncbi:hypothetical protein C6500_11715 [Candidatus Poribacteria bacterium]|nr:MAG: hypothetical protein C6500_11715 [Candidatus Poribacteria bacterium]